MDKKNIKYLLLNSIVNMVLLISIICLLTVKKDINDKRINKTIPIRVDTEQDGTIVFRGKRINDEEFQIALPFQRADIIVRQTVFTDLTNDGIDEMCIVMDISNTAVSDTNTIYVYDTLDMSLLFPTENKDSVYTGMVIELDRETPPPRKISYVSYTKLSAVAFIAEASEIGWVDGGFNVLGYKRKLLETDYEIAVFLNDYFPEGENTSAEFSIERFDNEDLEIIQRIVIDLGDTKNGKLYFNEGIEKNLVVLLEDRNKDGYNDIIFHTDSTDTKISKGIIFYWNSNKNCFLKE